MSVPIYGKYQIFLVTNLLLVVTFPSWHHIKTKVNLWICAFTIILILDSCFIPVKYSCFVFWSPVIPILLILYESCDERILKTKSFLVFACKLVKRCIIFSNTKLWSNLWCHSWAVKLIKQCHKSVLNQIKLSPSSSLFQNLLSNLT